MFKTLPDGFYRMKNAREIEHSTCKVCSAHRKHAKGTVCELISCPDPERVSSYKDHNWIRCMRWRR